MRKFLLLLLISTLTSVCSYAQRSIQSMVFESKNETPLEMATVRLLNPTDSSLVVGGRTNENGSFILENVKPGEYSLQISMVGYTDYRLNIKMGNKNLILKNIQLIENVQVLNTVEITGAAAQMVVRGDTTEYNATAFKTAQNAVVEDLLKRLPGVEVSADGKITINGQDIKKIRVDGKKFFGDDIEMTTKNIPAEMIDKIQVLEEKSDMAKLTGFEDNDTERIINLTTKANRKKGAFGNITGGMGLDTNNDIRYDGNTFMNIVDGNAQSAITAGGNNTNNSRSGSGRSGMGGTTGGINKTQNIGINNNTIVSPKLKMGGDASANHTTNESATDSYKQTYLKNGTYTNESKNKSNSENYSAKMRLELEWKPDSLNTIVIQPNIAYNRSFSNGSYTYSYKTDSVLTSFGNSSNHSNGNSLDASLNLIYSHKFASKKGRVLTTSVQSGIGQNNTDSWNQSLKTTKSNSHTDSIDQFTANISSRYNLNIKASFVEPLWNVRNLLEATISLRTTNSDSEKSQYKKLPNGEYSSTPDTTYSNVFENTFFSEVMELNYRYVAKEYNLMMGLRGEPSQTYSLRTYANGDLKPYTNEVVNFSPTGRFQYNFGRKKFARIDYRGQSDQASISQMQPVKNNSNQMNETVGNPTLNPAFNHNFRMFYSAFNDKTFSSFNVMMSAQGTKDAFVTNSIYDVTGKQFSQTVNAKTTPYNLAGNIMFNTPIIPKKLQFNTNTNFGISKRYGYSKKGVTTINTDTLILGDLSDTRKYNASESLSLTFTTQVLEIGTRGSLRYSNTFNNLNPVVSETYDWTVSGNVVLHLPYTINFATDLNFTTLQGYSNFDKKQLIWNASIDKSFFKNKGVLSLKVFDILRQQLNIRQTIGDNYIQYSSFNTLTSYFLLSFSMKINQFKGSKEPANGRPGFERFGPGGDHPYQDRNSGGSGGSGERGGFGGGQQAF